MVQLEALILILLTVALLFYIKTNLCASYDSGKASVTVSVLGIKKTLLPRSEKTKNKRKQSVKERYYYAKAAIKAFNKIKRSIIIEKLNVNYISSDDNPYTAVFKYNAANVLAVSSMTYLESCFKVKNRAINIDTDLTADKALTEMSAELSLRLGHIVYFVSVFGFELIKRRHRDGKQTQRNDAVGNEQRKAAG